MAIGTATIDFGSGNQIATVTVTGQAAILSGSNVEAFLMADTSADHTAYEHVMVPLRLVCGNVVAGTGFDIIGTCISARLIGQWTVRWVWA